ncbi:putative membrane protein YeaQ/YmgE (transglycosylase-associated protein family) [Methanobacterium petrolearium]|nr:putative membrane protein YeaQ/YmgE (transglycosylase-associated protein family) [Methanobacterium petrolearium]
MVVVVGMIFKRVEYGAFIGIFIPGVIVGYLVNNGYKNGAKNGIITGLIGGFILGIIIFITIDFNLPPFPNVVYYIFMFALFSAATSAILDAIGGIIGSLVKDKKAGSAYDDSSTAAVSGNEKGMINWRFSIIGAVLVVVLGVLQFYLIGFDLIWGTLVSGIVVGYLVNNGFKNGIINGFIAGLIGGLLLGILFYFVYIIVLHTSNSDISSPLQLVLFFLGMAVIFSFLGTLGGLVGSLIKKISKKMNSIIVHDIKNLTICS